jgi:hypothetical protein
MPLHPKVPTDSCREAGNNDFIVFVRVPADLRIFPGVFSTAFCRSEPSKSPSESLA